MAVDRTKFHETSGMVPSGVSVVTLPPAACPHGVTVNSFNCASLSPPRVSVPLAKSTDVHEVLQKTGVDAFCVNVLTADQTDVGRYFAGPERGENPFVSEQVRIAETGAPVFEDSLAYMDCTVHDTLDVGDHTIYVGEVQRAEVENRDATPLTHFRSQWLAAPDASSSASVREQ